MALVVLPLKAQAAGRAPKAALLFARASVCDSLMLGFFARCHGLTATEEHVLGILCEGFSAPQVAVQMKVAVSDGAQPRAQSLWQDAVERGARAGQPPGGVAACGASFLERTYALRAAAAAAGASTVVLECMALGSRYARVECFRSP